MTINNVFTVLQVDDASKSAAFYVENLGFEVVFEADWYVQLRTPAGHELALMTWDHDTVPESHRKKSQGVLTSIEVDDVDAIHQAFEKANIPILRSLRDEDFGQRHFIAEDPAGNLVDAIKQIPPSAEFAAMYS